MSTLSAKHSICMHFRRVKHLDIRAEAEQVAADLSFGLKVQANKCADEHMRHRGDALQARLRAAN